MSPSVCRCACCLGPTGRTPVEIVNRPGLPAVAYRTGTWAAFRASMRAGLAGPPELAALRTRADDDPAIALIDAWAAVADVLTFYTERIANEHYLRTATERRSVNDLTALVGYRLAPGVAARTWLAFFLETAPGAPESTVLPTGTRVQSLPGPGESPQTFETTEAVTAVGAWNRPRWRATGPRPPRTGDSTVLLDGTATGLRTGDALLFVAGRQPWSEALRWARARVVDVTADSAAGRTAVAFTPPLSGLDPVSGDEVTVHVLARQAALFGFNAPDPRLFDKAVRSGLDLVTTPRVDWNFAALDPAGIKLDALYEGTGPAGWAVLTSDTAIGLARVDSVSVASAADYGVSGRVTVLGIRLLKGRLSEHGGTASRRTAIEFQSKELPLAEVPSTDPLTGRTVPLAELLPALPADRQILLRGKRARAQVRLTPTVRPTPLNRHRPRPMPRQVEATVLSVRPATELPGLLRWTVRTDDGVDHSHVGLPETVTYLPARAEDEVVGEVVTVTGTTAPAPLSALTLRTPLTHVYDVRGPTPVELYGNIAAATHGETVTDEVLGSADAARPYQRFALRHKPLTWIPASTVTGAASTLQVRVNGLAWHETPVLYGTGPRDRVHTTRTDENGTTTVGFGDGTSGAATPTGVDNVTATYRWGIGAVGNVRAERLTLPMVRPLGLGAVTNPLPAIGGQDPQSIADARTNAPRSVLTLGRVVSLRDYADFAASYAGVAKGTAVWTWDRARKGVAVTVALDGPVPPDLLAALRRGLLAAGNPRVPLVVSACQPASFAVRAALRVAEDHDPEQVRDAVAAALLAAFSLPVRDFGQDVSLSELTAVAHSVAGVSGVRVDRLHRRGEAAALHTRLPARSPLPGGPPDAPPAEILTLTREGIDLEVGW
ncbi:putative baseplate assembly protein [Streptomyces sp. NPDC096132]|uniref:putative baseplate assembly protein n=1 Tax=Streptomyces sp. NPDC096132 TaxID=3366075 RepID=UPI0038061B38